MLMSPHTPGDILLTFQTPPPFATFWFMIWVCLTTTASHGAANPPLLTPKTIVESAKGAWNINLDTLTIDLQHLSSADFSSVTESVDFYNRSLSSLLDLHTPVRTRTVTFLRPVPYTCELQKMGDSWACPWATSENKLIENIRRPMQSPGEMHDHSSTLKSSTITLEIPNNFSPL